MVWLESRHIYSKNAVQNFRDSPLSEDYTHYIRTGFLDEEKIGL